MNIKYPIELEMVLQQCFVLDVVVKGKKFGTKLPGFTLWPFHFLAK